MGEKFDWRAALSGMESMKTIHIICEGQTEAYFVKNVLWKNLGYANYLFNPIIVETKIDHRKGKMHKGGVPNFDKIDKTIKQSLSFLKNNDAFITTMFDYYGLPNDFPGMTEAKKLTDVYQKIEKIESSLKGYYNNEFRFVPYIQLHEFETLVFACMKALKTVFFDDNDTIPWKILDDVISQHGNVELINNSIETAPSKRLEKCIKSYDKVYSGIQALQQTDFKTIRRKCKHFDAWVSKLEQL